MVKGILSLDDLIACQVAKAQRKFERRRAKAKTVLKKENSLGARGDLAFITKR